MSKALFMAASAAGVAAKTYVDDVFSTYLYTGTDATQTITNGIDLAGNGGLVWTKGRTVAVSSYLVDSARSNFGASLQSNEPNGQEVPGVSFTASSNGYSIGAYNRTGSNGEKYASWTFRKAPKFFDVVTWTGNATNRDIAHSLGVAPGCILVKRTDTTADWQVYHRSLANTEYLVLNSTAAKATGSTRWNSTTANASTFRIGTDASVNASGGNYVAYVFAHDTDTVDGLIQCGTFTASGGVGTVSLGWEPQWVIYKNTATAGQPWYMLDTMRGWAGTGTSIDDKALFAESSAAESDAAYGNPTATGFVAQDLANDPHIYIAIRRPNKPPTVGTQVFGLATSTTAVDSTTPKTLAVPAADLWLDTLTSGQSRYWLPRLTGWGYLQSDGAGGETAASSYNFQQIAQDKLLPSFSWWSGAPAQISWFFKRAPGFFDVVAYTGDGTNSRGVPHGLGATPELVIVKRRNAASSVGWWVYSPSIGGTNNILVLNSSNGRDGFGTLLEAPTSTTFVVNNNDEVNGSGSTYISYLFATLAGISKVGTYTGNGSSQTINCGFTTGARFVLIKRTNSTGDWYVWDTARGIVPGNDPHLSLNTAAAEVTTNDTIDPDTSGFIVNQVAATNINVNAATYIYLAIA